MRAVLGHFASAIVIPGVLLAQEKTSSDFLLREGRELHLAGKPLRLVAVNKFDLFLKFLEGGQARQQAAAAVEEAGRCGFTAIRFAGVGFFPKDMQNWCSEKAYWGTFDELVKTAKANGVRLIPVIHWNTYLFPDMAGECVRDMIVNPDSRSRQYLWLYTYQIVSRYKAEPTVLFWELTNEMNLGADLEFQFPFGHAALNPVNAGTAYMRLRRDNFTTDQMIPFLKAWAEFIRGMDRNHLIATGFAVPRAAAQHLRLAQGSGDWTQDSEQELTTYLRDTNPDPIELISIHFYRQHGNLRLGNKDQDSVAPLAAFKRAADTIGKPLYVGETGDDYAARPSAPFLKDVLSEVVRLNIPLTLVWNWMSPNDRYDLGPVKTPEVVSLMRQANGRFSPASGR
jgi:hypothetical protein